MVSVNDCVSQIPPVIWTTRTFAEPNVEWDFKWDFTARL